MTFAFEVCYLKKKSISSNWMDSGHFATKLLYSSINTSVLKRKRIIINIRSCSISFQINFRIRAFFSFLFLSPRTKHEQRRFIATKIARPCNHVGKSFLDQVLCKRCSRYCRAYVAWRCVQFYKDWRTKQASQLACASEELKCCGFLDTTWGQKAINKPQEIEKLRKRKRSTVFLDRTRKGHRQSDEHLNCFTRATAERRDVACMGFSERVDIISNWS